MKHFNEQISKAKTIAITGHIHPDGDCIGSCLALKQYILDNYSGKKVDVYLESISTEFRFLSHAQEIITESKDDESYDLFFVLDCGSEDRGFESLHSPHFLFLCRILPICARGCRQAVRHRTLTPVCVGSNPAIPAI